MPRKKKPGRPAGSRNVSADHAEGKLTRCKQCGSTEREPYYKMTEQEHGGIDPDGQPYTHIVRRWTRCRSCPDRPVRIDRFYENRQPATDAGGEGS